MAIPDFQTLMRPFLEVIQDGAEYDTINIVERLAQTFTLSSDERKELLPSGRQAKFDNRVGWTRTHLKKAGLIESSARGKVNITGRGEDALTDAQKIDMRFLNQFPEYIAFRTSQTVSQTQSPSLFQTAKTPQEVIAETVQQLDTELAEDLLERIMKSPPKFFEQLVIDLLLAMGYGGSRREAGHAIGGSGDGGIDGTINEDRLGLDTIYVQAKRWSNNVDVKTVREFGGALMGQGATKGVLITPSSFTPGANDYAKNLKQVKIVLIDGRQLTKLMIQHGIGVAETERFVLKKVDSDYFDV